MNIALIGHGKMGRELEHMAAGRNMIVRKIFSSGNNRKSVGLSKKELKGIDVCIDFSTPAAVMNNIEAVAASGKNIVVGTTGWYAHLDRVRKLVKQSDTGLLYSPNFSLGMNIFVQILASALRYIDVFQVYDAAIHEVHHVGKADSPSGTATMLGEIILKNLRGKKEILDMTPHEAIKPSQLHITSSRLGSVVGTHCVTFDSEADSIELIHTAKDRSGFALGALIAAEWLNGKKGVFTMNDVVTSR